MHGGIDWRTDRQMDDQTDERTEQTSDNVFILPCRQLGSDDPVLRPVQTTVDTTEVINQGLTHQYDKRRFVIEQEFYLHLLTIQLRCLTIVPTQPTSSLHLLTRFNIFW